MLSGSRKQTPGSDVEASTKWYDWKHKIKKIEKSLFCDVADVINCYNKKNDVNLHCLFTHFNAFFNRIRMFYFVIFYQITKFDTRLQRVNVVSTLLRNSRYTVYTSTCTHSHWAQTYSVDGSPQNLQKTASGRASCKHQVCSGWQRLNQLPSENSHI